MITLDAVAEGAAMVTENLFEARFRFVQEIARLGADVRVDGHHALVRGVPSGCRVLPSRPATSGPVPRWCWPASSRRARPWSWARGTSTAATRGWTRH